MPAAATGLRREIRTLKSISAAGRPDDTYLIQYTSGTTAILKPVVVTAGAAAHNAPAAYNVPAAMRAFGLQLSSVNVSWLPQYHHRGLMFLLLTVVAGATCVLASPQPFLWRPRLWLEMIAEFAATCAPVPSFALPLILKRGRVGHGKTPLNLYVELGKPYSDQRAHI